MPEWRLPGYTELRALGSGGFGDVVLARHDESGTSVAIKYLHRGLLADPGFAAMFRAEAAVLASLDDPNVVRLYQYVEGPAGAAIVMELIDGVSVREILSRQGATIAEAALVVLQGSLLGLAAAHARGVVHRDYKPENVLVNGEGVSKLTDFGIAARSGDRAIAAGTLAYAPPEQFSGALASPAGDVYAATATFYECLTGHPPFTGQTAEALLAQHRSGRVPMEAIPEPLRPLVAAGMARDPGDRPANATAFVTELRAAAAGAYGEDWEDRGRSRLAEAAVLLAALWPSGTALAAPAIQGSAVEEVSLPARSQASRESGHLRHLEHVRHEAHTRHLGRLRALMALGAAAVVGAAVAVVVVTAGSSHSPSGGGSAASQPGTSSPRAAQADLPWPPAAWTLDSSPALSGGLLDVVACPAAGTCTVATAGSQGSTASFALYSDAQGKWAPEATVPTSLPNDSFNPTAMTCPQTADCTVIGADYEAVSKRSEVSLVATKSQRGWTTTQLPLPTGSGSAKSMELDGIACPGAGDCVAVGELSESNTAANGAPQPVIATLQRGIWTVALAPLPADASASPVAADLAAISCTAPGSCVAVGSYLAASGGWRPLIETLANGNWTPGAAPLAPNTDNVMLYSVACPAAGTCVAVGNNVYGNSVGPGTDPGVIETLADGTWSVATAPQPTGAPGQFWGYLWGVACPAPGSCVAVGGYNTAKSQTSLPQIDTLSDGTWTAAIAGSLPADAATKSQQASADDVACTLTRDCVTLVEYTNRQGFLESAIESTSTARPSPSLSPSPSASNSLAAAFSDGTQVLVTGGEEDGGNGWTEYLEVIAGPGGFSNVGGLQVQAAGSSAWEADGSPDFFYGYAAPGNSGTDEPPLPSDATNHDVSPPAELAPGTSICVQQYFQNANSSPEDDSGPDEYSVTATLSNGAKETVSLPTDGSGPGNACLFTG
jgi:hypothetical protein